MTNLLLLFSAMLSALVGVGPGGRVVEAPAAVTSVAAERAAPIALKHVAARPLPPRAGIVAVLVLGVIVLMVLPAPIPAWKTRRRE